MSDALESARVAAAGQRWLLTAAQALRSGMSRGDVAGELRRGRWLTVTPGVYLLDPDMYADGLPQATLRRAALLGEGDRAFLVASSAVRELGVQGLPEQELVIDVATIGGGSRHPRELDLPGQPLDMWRPTVRVRQLVVPAHEIVRVNGVPIRHARHSIVDAALGLDRATALAVLDSALHLEALTPDELAHAVDAAAGRRGVITLRWLRQRADGRAESPVESRLRLACIDEGVAPDDLQHPIADEVGNLTAVADLAWFRRRRRPLLAEADGVCVHSLPEPVYRDRRRGNALVGHACDTVRFTVADSYRPKYVGYVVRAALAAAS